MATVPMKMDELRRIRALSYSVRDILRAELNTHIATITPLFRPKRLLGRFIAGPAAEDPPGADRAFNKLTETFKKVAAQCDVGSELTPPIPKIKAELTVHPWERVEMVGGRALRIISPTRYLISYAGNYDPLDMLRPPSMQSALSAAATREFVINSLVLNTLLDEMPGVRDLLMALRFQSETVAVPALGNLNLTRLSAPIASFRPTDDVVLAVVDLTGADTFEELVDPDAIAQLADPLRDKLSQAVQAEPAKGS